MGPFCRHEATGQGESQPAPMGAGGHAIFPGRVVDTVVARVVADERRLAYAGASANHSGFSLPDPRRDCLRGLLGPVVPAGASHRAARLAGSAGDTRSPHWNLVRPVRRHAQSQCTALVSATCLGRGDSQIALAATRNAAAQPMSTWLVESMTAWS